MQLSILYTSIALLKLTLAMWDNTHYCYMGSLHQIHALETAKLKICQILSLAISPNSSATQYNPIAKDFLGAGNLDIFCRHSGVRYCIHDLFKNTNVDLSLLTVHAGLLQINILFLIPYTENYMA